ncbi:MAG TPA: flagellar hook-associated protein FlgK [Anaeromyxobacter sp.]|nr:flagellar hook-associated protein FlgK [Anaeromyxobacter sp.]
MVDLFHILSMGASSLDAQTGAAATNANNLENVDTPGYARQMARLEPSLPSELVGNTYVGNGATLGQVTQARDRFVEAQLPVAFGNAASSDATAKVLGAVSVLDPQGSGGLSSALSGFYSAFSALSQNASDPSLRQAAVAAAGALALSFQQTRGSLESARSGADQSVAGDVSEVNSLASQVASLNGQIRAASASGAQPNDLLDARQKAIDQLAQLTGATVVPTSEGDASLFLPGGAALVSSLQAATLSAVPDPSNNGHLALNLSLGGTTSSVSPGGELGGLLSARDGGLGSAVSGLDTLAWDLAGAINTVHQAGVDLDGNAGQALFTVSSAAGAAAQIAVNPAIVGDTDLLATRTTGGTGDASNVLALLATSSTPLSGGQDASATLAQITSAFGAAAQSASAASEADDAIKTQLVTMRQSTSSVSTDDELVEMQKTQQAYAAIAKVISTTDSMLDTLVQIT